MEGQVGTICPYCAALTRVGEDLLWCSECGVGHHHVCWVRHGGCTTKGCRGVSTRVVGVSRVPNRVGRLFGDPTPREAAGKTCPYCQQRIAEGETVLACARCDIPHHAECWAHNGGCSTYGCVRQPWGGGSAAVVDKLSGARIDLSSLGGDGRSARTRRNRVTMTAVAGAAIPGVAVLILTGSPWWALPFAVAGWALGVVIGRRFARTEAVSQGSDIHYESE